MVDIGPAELLVILVIALLVLGPKRLPDAGRAMGKGIRDFKAALGGDDEDPEQRHDPPELESQPAGTRDEHGPAAGGSGRTTQAP